MDFIASKPLRNNEVRNIWNEFIETRNTKTKRINLCRDSCDLSDVGTILKVAKEKLLSLELRSFSFLEFQMFAIVKDFLTDNTALDELSISLKPGQASVIFNHIKDSTLTDLDISCSDFFGNNSVEYLAQILEKKQVPEDFEYFM